MKIKSYMYQVIIITLKKRKNKFKWRLLIGSFSLAMVGFLIADIIAYGTFPILGIVIYGWVGHKTIWKEEMLSKWEKVAFIIFISLSFIFSFFFGSLIM